MSRELRAALLYVLLAFGLGFVLGPVRELFLAPALGRVGALLVELPLLLAACWWLAPRVMRQVPPGVGRLRAGFAALALLLFLEFTLGIVLRGWDLAQWMQGFWTAHGAVTLAGYWLFALIPYWRGVGARGPG
ncbi:MAG TPA: hypothetical protein VGN96_18665 [Roseococcus sp.]|jgi:hypothetical protein|nr:hypothetical protein [Roseococcus sp.]